MKQLFKKSIFIALILIELTTVMVSAATISDFNFNEKSNEADPVFKPRVSISFTIARRRDCTGFGICELSFDISSGKVNSCSGTMYLDDASKNTIIIEVDKASGIKAESYSKYFASGIFVMEDETPIPGDIMKAMGLSGSKFLLAGNHKIQERNGKMYVAIPVR